MARRLGAGLSELSAIRIAQPVESNAVFAYLPSPCIPALLEQAHFYDWEEPELEGKKLARLMASFDTTEDDVDNFVAVARTLLG